MSANFQSAKLCKGLAIASVNLGIVSVFMLGLFVVGVITSIILGNIAMNKIKRYPQVYRGKKLAVAGIKASTVSLNLIIIYGFLSMPMFLEWQEQLKLGRETAAIKSLMTIHQKQAQHKAMMGQFGSLQELNQSGLLGQAYLNGQTVSGYIYSASGVSTDSYCIHADRASDSTAYKDFVVCEDGILCAVESKTKGTVKRADGKALKGPPAAPSITP